MKRHLKKVFLRSVFKKVFHHIAGEPSSSKGTTSANNLEL